MTPCSDCAGEVAAVGDGVTRVKIGDRVAGIFMQAWIDGEVTEAKAKSALGGAIGGCWRNRSCCMRTDSCRFRRISRGRRPLPALRRGHRLARPDHEGGLKAGDTVVTLGSGGVSLFALQFARLAGARVIATSGSDEKLARLIELGASEGINYKTTPDWDKRVRELTGAGADHIVEVGGALTLPKSLKAVRMGGRISLIGNGGRRRGIQSSARVDEECSHPGNLCRLARDVRSHESDNRGAQDASGRRPRI